MDDVAHDWLELTFNGTYRRWCCTAFAKGGCGAYQVWRDRDSHNRVQWFPPVEATCTQQRAKVQAWNRNRVGATHRYRARRRRTPLWFWQCG
jgi:hypothetical protein